MGKMGKKLSLNLSSKGFSVSAYNREINGEEESIAVDFEKKNKEFDFTSFNTLPEFIRSLASPRKVFLMINSGHPTDEILTQLMMLLDPGDIIVDLGNSYFIDSQRRSKFLAQKKNCHLHYTSMAHHKSVLFCRFQHLLQLALPTCYLV